MGSGGGIPFIDNALDWANDRTGGLFNLTPGVGQLGLIYDTATGRPARQAMGEAQKAQEEALNQQRAEQDRLQREQQAAADAEEKQRALANERMLEESLYAQQAAGGIDTILTGGGGASASIQNKGRRTLLGSFYDA